jgi:alpha-glucosidase
MKKILLSVLFISILVFTGCGTQNAPLSNATSMPVAQQSTSTAVPTPILNAIQQALATQKAIEASQPTTPPISVRSGIVLPKNSLHVSSPNGRNEVLFGLIDGVPYYAIRHGEADVVLPSKLGFTFLKDAPLDANFIISNSETSSFDETWTQPWGEVKNIRDQHNELRVELTEQNAEARKMILVFRVFDDGIGFRYELPEQPNLTDIQIMKEETEFALSGDHSAWWIGAFQDNRDEYLFRNTSVSEMLKKATSGVLTPLTMQTKDGLYLSFHEAALVHYSSMALDTDENLVMHARLYPWSDGVMVKGHTPLVTPWRTIQIAERPGDLVTSYLILNLNEPNKLGDVSWIKPQKYIGIWWGMHIGKWTWGSGPNHGATTENTKAYLDFAAKYGFDGVLVEGWNEGWNGDWSANGERFSFTTPFPDYDLKGLAAYAKSKGVKIIGHNETSTAIANYESQMEDAFALYQNLGINTVKTGYVGYGQHIQRFDDKGDLLGLEWHYGQYMVEHYQRVVETAAKYGIMIDAHETIKDTGLRRTYPNFMTREAARGQEYNAWDGAGGNPPDHVVIMPFTRLLAGPMDYTPGVISSFKQYHPKNQINDTVAKELALYVVIYSPLQMAADLIENYEGNPAFQFILDVPADWNETRILNAQIGDYITTVRQKRDSDEWFLGSITDENSRELNAPLDFLTPGVTYTAEIYSDKADADWKTNPFALDINRVLVDSSVDLKLVLAPGGGQAIRFYPATQEDIATLPTYQP